MKNSSAINNLMPKVYWMVAGITLFVTTTCSYLLLKKRRTQQDDSQIGDETSNLEHKQLYQEALTDPHYYDLCEQFAKQNTFVQELQYEILLNLNKGNIYQGVVEIKFKISPSYSLQHFPINYNGLSIKHASVNGKLLSPANLIYSHQQIKLPTSSLSSSSLNHILIIYENKYSFIANGLSSYFLLDQNNKYSLKEQVIYTHNGLKQITTIIPCLNCTNNCKVSLKVLHPEGFEVFSNSIPSMHRKCTEQEFPQYTFFFNLSDHCSYRLKSSSTSNVPTNLEESTIHVANSLFKLQTNFYSIKIPSIHHMFMLSAHILQIKPNLSPKQTPILLRYFCKHHKQPQIGKNISTLHQHLTDICCRLKQQQVEHYIAKIDIFFITGNPTHGYFSPGVILLDEQCLKDGVSMQTFYLLCRAVFGIIQIQSNKQLLTYKDIIHLNQTTLQIFPQCYSFIYLKQVRLHKLKHLIMDQDCSKQYCSSVLQFFNTEIPFIINKDCKSKVSSDLSKLISRLLTDDMETYWSNFIIHYNFMSPYIAELVLQISIASQGIPKDCEWLIQFAHKNLKNSSYLLCFIPDIQLQNNLGQYLDNRTPGLQKRLPKIKVKQKFRKHITEHYERYLPISANREEVCRLYEQFKHFRQNKNFHHISILDQQIGRIISFLGNDIKEQRIEIQCGISDWRILTKLKIYPVNQQLLSLLKRFNDALQEQVDY